MASITTSAEIYNKIKRLINSSRFNESFLLLRNNLKAIGKPVSFLSKLSDAESNYKYMLAYISSNQDDPAKDQLIKQVKEILNTANDILLRENKLKDSSDIYSSTRRMFELRQDSFASLLGNFKSARQADLDLSRNSDPENTDSEVTFSPLQSKALSDLFNYVWTINIDSSDELEEIRTVIEDNSYPNYLKLQLISALTLGSLEYFSATSFDLFLSLYESQDSDDIKARILSGILLIALVHSERLESNLQLSSRLLLFAEEEEFNKIINDSLLTIIKTYDTKRIDDKIRNDVIPDLLKINPEIIDKMRNMASDSESFLSDTNPDWEDILEKSEIGKKIQELNDMQMEGADVMVTAFSNLKNFPFFNQINNWFIPYIPGSYEFKNNRGISGTEIEIEQLNQVMCDSDLHSFLLSMQSMAQFNRDRMMNNLENQMKQIKEAMSDSIGESQSKALRRKIKQNLQDTYRFYKFFRKKNDFKDPFESAFVSKNLKPLKNMMGLDSDSILLTAEFYFKNKYYTEAADIFEYYDSVNPGNFNIWEKIGYCYERLQNYEFATEWYLKAELVNPGSKWLEKRLAISLKNAGKLAEALPFYQKSLEHDPENYHFLMSLSQCLIDLNKYSDSVSHLYHAQYIKPDKIDPQRALAWVELLSGDFDKAVKSYLKVLNHSESDKTDYLNLAHAYLASGNFGEALKNYRFYVDKSENSDIKNLVLAFRDDSEIMKKLGIKTSDLRLIVDKIRYDMSVS